jgi:anti-anti-sigma regulatory factor
VVYLQHSSQQAGRASVRPLLTCSDDAGFGRIQFTADAELRWQDAPQILDELDGIMADSSARDFLVDLGNLKQAGRGGLLLFLTLRDYVGMRSGRCVFFGASQAVAGYLREHLLDELLLVAEDESAALQVLAIPKPIIVRRTPLLRGFSAPRKTHRLP